MQGMILAAGFGTRLAPYTDNCPKALVPLNNRPLLGYIIDKYIASGITDIVINAHYLSNQIIDFVKSNNFNAEIKVIVEKDILGTGGGIFNMLEYITDEDFFVYNTDVISSIDLKNLMNFHKQNSPLATMVMQDRETFNQVVIDNKEHFCGLKYVKTGKEIITKQPVEPYKLLAFSGIHVINKNIYKYKSTEKEFSIISTYLDAVKNSESILSYHPDIYWKDVGTIKKLREAEKYLTSLHQQ
ncbi:MAG: sugar phosphate nucleotidyltransferase [Candidatus Delongbacteria bacterium]|jgi:MurNAc alpha-1-phosphate uridylyltransferase|nr:sugar phosphate nucleotidyltransferase [Candidatus Delongbacteria bacterium]